MKVSAKQKPGQEITLTGSATGVAAGWLAVLTIPPGIFGKLRHFQLTMNIVGASGWTQVRILRGAVALWTIHDETGNSNPYHIPRPYDCETAVQPGDVVQVLGYGTPSFTLDVSCVATIFPPPTADRFTADESYPICGLRHVDQGRPDLCRLAALSSLLTFYASALSPFGGNPQRMPDF